MESKIAFANILMARMEQAILRQNKEKPLVWKRFIDDMIFFIWDTNKEEKIELFIEKADAYHLIIKCTDEVSEIETTFLDTTEYKGERFEKESHPGGGGGPMMSYTGGPLPKVKGYIKG